MKRLGMLIALFLLGTTAEAVTNTVLNCATCTPGAAVTNPDPIRWMVPADGLLVLVANNATTSNYFDATWRTWESVPQTGRVWRCSADRTPGQYVNCGGSEGFALKSSLGPPPPPPYTEPRTLRWDAPTTNANGTPLTDLAGYRLAHGTSPGVYTENITLGLVTTYNFPALGVGPHYFGVYARDTSGNESTRSNEFTTTVSQGPPPTQCTSPQPPDQTRVQSCPAPQTGSWTQTNAFIAAPFPTCWVPGNNWVPVNPPPGACVTPPPPQTPRVVAVVVGLSHSPAFGITAAGGRGTAVVGFVPVGTACTGAIVYRYRSEDYYRVAAGTTVWWATTPTANAAVACRLQ